MKKYLLVIACMITSIFNAQSQCTDLFISEYVEGWNNNKALELYNPTANTISLTGYRIARYSNGSTTASTVDLSGSISAYSAVVMVIDKQDTTLTGQDTAAWEELRDKADYFLCPDYNVSSAMYFNGNDAVTLEKTDNTIIDIFGKVGEDPGSSWTDVFPYTDAAGNYWTKDQTLVRKPSVKTGISTNPTYFNPTTEWDSLPANTFDSLGSHTCDCYTGSSKINEVVYHDNIYLFPNPLNQSKVVSIKGTSTIEKAEIYNASGTLVYNQRNTNKSGEITLDLSNLSASLYFVRVVFDNKQSVIKQLTIN